MGCPIEPVEVPLDGYDTKIDNKKAETDQRRNNLTRSPAQASQGNSDVSLKSEEKLTIGGSGGGADDKKKENGNGH